MTSIKICSTNLQAFRVETLVGKAITGSLLSSYMSWERLNAFMKLISIK